MTAQAQHCTFLSSTRFTPCSLEKKGRMRSTCSALSPNNWAITHLLLVLSWVSLSGERIIPHVMSPDPSAGIHDSSMIEREWEMESGQGRVFKV